MAVAGGVIFFVISAFFSSIFAGMPVQQVSHINYITGLQALRVFKWKEVHL